MTQEILRTLPLAMLLFVTCNCESHFVNAISPKREAMAKLRDDLSSHRVLANRMYPLSTDGQVDLTFHIWLDQVTEVVEAKQKVEISMSLQMRWEDRNLAWDKEYYGNVSVVNIPPDAIWYPEVYISNSADENFCVMSVPHGIKLHSTGQIDFLSANFISTQCNFDLTYYPFDTQNCTIVISYDDQEGVIRPMSVSLDDPRSNDIASLLHSNREWTIESRSSRLYHHSNYGIVEIAFSMRRATMYYYLCVLVPMLSTSMLTLLVFWIPPASGEKMSYLVSIYVSTALYLSFVGDTLPRNMSKTNTPRMTLFLVFVIAECVVALVATVFVMRRHHQEAETDNLKHQGDNDERCKKGKLFQSRESYEKPMQEGELVDPNQETAVRHWSNVLTKLVDICRRGSPNDDKQNGRKLAKQAPLLSATEFDTIFFWILFVICVLFYSLVFVV